MEAAGVIRGYGASVDRESVGLSLCVLAEVNLTQHTENTVREFERAVAACPQIVSCYSTTGAADYSIKVLVAGHQELRVVPARHRRSSCRA
jgi:DNA-binding Lrp family transcriptional regulator